MRKSNSSPCPGQTIARAMVLVNGRPAPGLVLFWADFDRAGSVDDFTVELRLSAQERVDSEGLIETFPHNAIIELLAGYPPNPENFTADDLTTLLEGHIECLMRYVDTDEVVIWGSTKVTELRRKDRCVIRDKQGNVTQTFSLFPKDLVYRVKREESEIFGGCFDFKNLVPTERLIKQNAEFDETRPYDIKLRMNLKGPGNMAYKLFSDDECDLEISNSAPGNAKIILGQITQINGAGKMFDRYYLNERIIQIYSVAEGLQTAIEMRAAGPCYGEELKPFPTAAHH